MKKIYTLLSCILMLHAINTNAQCPGNRYISDVFSSSDMSTVTYSSVYGLQMDIYQPTGDLMTARPLIILAHEGSFIGSSRNEDVTVDSLCVRFARRGYVTASIDYRLSTIGNMVSTDSSLAIDEVIKAISDGKAAIRYFMKDAATTNTYRIDTNNIFIGGNSAGSVLYMHVGYLDSIQECPSYIVSAMDSNGGFEGNSGNAGYTTKSKAIINLAGALNETSFVGLGDKPSVNAQGDNDAIVPYTCAEPNFGSPSLPVVIHVNLCGLGSLEPAYTSNGIVHMSHVFPGDGHVPWDADPVKFNTVDSLVRVFLYNQVCSDSTTAVTSVKTITPEVSLFPNPANEVANIKSSQPVSAVTIYDETGRTIFNAEGLGTLNYEINTAHFSKGLYFIKVSFSSNNVPVTKRIVVE